jgi:hypothetical protein
MRYFTYTLTTGSIYIQNTDGASFLSIQCGASDSCTLQGNLSFKGLSSNAVSIGNNQGISLASPPTSSLDGITITHVSGNVDILIGL